MAAPEHDTEANVPTDNIFADMLGSAQVAAAGGPPGNIFADLTPDRTDIGAGNVFADLVQPGQAQANAQPKNIFADLPRTKGGGESVLAEVPESSAYGQFKAGVRSAAGEVFEGAIRTPSTLKRILVDTPNELIDRGLKSMGLDPEKYNPRVKVGLNALADKSEALANEFSEQEARRVKNDPDYQALNYKSQQADQAVKQALDGDFRTLGQVLTDPEAWAGFIGQGAPSLAIAAATGGSLPVIAWLEGMSEANSAAEFEEKTGVKISPTEYSKAVTQVALVNGLLERAGLEQLLHGKGKNLLATFLKNTTKEGGTEFLQNLNQNAAAQGYDQSRELLDGSLQATMGGVGLGAAATPGTHFLGGQAEDRQPPPADDSQGQDGGPGEPPIILQDAEDSTLPDEWGFDQIRPGAPIEERHDAPPESQPEQSSKPADIHGRRKNGELAAVARQVGGKWQMVIYEPDGGKRKLTADSAEDVAAKMREHGLDVPGDAHERPRFRLFEDGFTSPSDTLKDRIIYQLQDRFVDLKRIQGAIEEGGGRVDDASDAYMREALYHGRAEKRVRDFRDRHVEPLLKQIKDSGLTLDEVNDYLYARHAVERNAEMAKINPSLEPGEGSGMTDEEAAAVMRSAEDEGKTEALDRVARDVDTIIGKSRRLLVNSGLEPTDTVGVWKNTYQHYVPLRGFEDGESEPSVVRNRGFDMRGREPHALGRKSRAANILVNVMAQYESAAVRAEKNRIGQSLLRLVQANPNPGLWEINPVEHKRTRDPNTGLVVRRRDLGYRTADNVLTVKVDGKEHHIRFKTERGKRLARALKNLDATNQNKVFGALRRFNRLLASLSTSWNPEFVISNFVRDLQAAALNLSDTELHDAAGKTFRDVPKALAGIAAAKRGKDTTWARHFEAYERAGGKTGWIDAHQSLEDIQAQMRRYARELERSKGDPREVTKKLARSLAGSVVAANEIVENSTRLAAFVNARRMGMSPDRAADLAKNLTVNFNRRGASGDMLNALYLFFNAAMQGSARLIRVLGSKRGRRLAVALVVAAALQDMLARLMAGWDDDDDWYDKIPDYVKERNWIFPTGNGGYIKIPLPYGWNVFKVIGDQFGKLIASKMGAARFDPAESVMAVGSAITGSFNPLGAQLSTPLQLASPTVGDSIIQVAMGKDWTGRDLYPSRNPFELAPEPDSQQKWNSTNPLAVTLAEGANEATGGSTARPGAVDVSPITLEHVTEFMTGGLGRFLSDAGSSMWQGLVKGEPVESHSVPFVHRVYGEVGDWAGSDLFYENLKSIEYAVKDLEAARDRRDHRGARDIRREYRAELGLSSQAEAIRRQAGRIRRQIDRIKHSDLPDKRERIERLQERIAQRMKRFNQLYLEATEER